MLRSHLNQVKEPRFWPGCLCGSRIIITSKDNPKIKQVRSLRQRKGRQAAGLFLVEGIRHVGEAAEASAAGNGHPRLAYICYAPALLNSDYALQLIQKQEAAGIPCYAVDSQLFITLVEKENPQGILAVVEQRYAKLEDLYPGNMPWGVALVAPQDPGNIGTVLRTIDAVGGTGLFLLDNSADPYYPSSVRASMGAIFWHPIVQTGFPAFAGWARQHSYHIYGASAHGNQDYRDVECYEQPAILLMGSEREGLTQEQIQYCEHLIRLPMNGKVTSLNLGVATGVLLYEMLRKF